MKKYLLIIFAALVLMLTACARASEEADGGTGTPEITTAPTQTTAQTQPTATTQQLTTKPTETTVPPTTEVTVPPTTQPVETTQPTEPSTEPTQPTYLITIDRDTEDGVPVVSGLAGNNDGTNGFFWNKDRSMAISIHSGTPELVDVHSAVIHVTHQNVEYVLEFKWCTDAGEVDACYDPRTTSGIYCRPIVGNDQYIIVTVYPESGEDHLYLLELETLQIIDPSSIVKADFNDDIVFNDFSPDLHHALIAHGGQVYLLDMMTGEAASIQELTGLTDYQNWDFVDNKRISFQTLIGGDGEYDADCVVYNMTDGTMTTLYTGLNYGWLIDTGGVESKGRVHVHNHDVNSGVCIIDCVTGVHSVTGLPDVLQIDHCGPEKLIICTWSSPIYYLVEPDGTATPVFTKQ